MYNVDRLEKYYPLPNYHAGSSSLQKQKRPTRPGLFCFCEAILLRETNFIRLTEQVTFPAAFQTPVETVLHPPLSGHLAEDLYKVDETCPEIIRPRQR